MAELPKAAIERLIRRAGAKRVSDSAVEALAELLEEVADDVSSQALKLARHANRKTITGEDIKIASRT
jgi:histone H3/H4